MFSNMHSDTLCEAVVAHYVIGASSLFLWHLYWQAVLARRCIN